VAKQQATYVLDQPGLGRACTGVHFAVSTIGSAECHLRLLRPRPLSTWLVLPCPLFFGGIIARFGAVHHNHVLSTAIAATCREWVGRWESALPALPQNGCTWHFMRCNATDLAPCSLSDWTAGDKPACQTGRALQRATAHGETFTCWQKNDDDVGGSRIAFYHVVTARHSTRHSTSVMRRSVGRRCTYESCQAAVLPADAIWRGGVRSPLAGVRLPCRRPFLPAVSCGMLRSRRSCERRYRE
jgi:hypothetical protein